VKKGLNFYISPNLYIYPQFFAEIQSENLGFYGKNPSRATPPVNKNRRLYWLISPLNSASLVHNKNENISLSFSNSDLQMFEYNE
jgi:hypothetical protein